MSAADAPYIQGPPLRDDGPLETMARAMEAESDFLRDSVASETLERCLAAAFTALTEAGHAIVPVDPTEAVLDAYWGTIERHPDRAEGTEPYPLAITVYHALVNAGKVAG